MKEIKSLTTLRALAAVLVFMFHYAYLHAPAQGAHVGPFGQALMPVWRQGQVGVSIFFVLSGFLITRIYYDAFAGGEGSLRRFYVKRVARIWPLFLLFAAIQHGASAALGERPSASWLVTCTLTQGFFRDLRHGGLPTAWSLTIEESFYALAPVMFVVLAAGGVSRATSRSWATSRAARLVGLLAVFAGTFLAAGLAVMFASARLGWSFAGFMSGPRHVLHSTLAGRFPEFAVGMACAFVHRAGWPRRLAPRHASALAVTCVAGIGAIAAGKDYAERHAWSGMGYAMTLAIVLLTGALILSLTREESWISRVLSARWAVYLGKISYGFYLMQASLLLVPLQLVADRLGPLRLPVLFVLMNLFCAACYEAVERPARRFIVARFGGPEGPA